MRHFEKFVPRHKRTSGKVKLDGLQCSWQLETLLTQENSTGEIKVLVLAPEGDKTSPNDIISPVLLVN